MKQSVANCVFNRASVHTENASSGTSFAPEQNCSALLLKVERPVSDRLQITNEHKTERSPFQLAPITVNRAYIYTQIYTLFL